MVLSHTQGYSLERQLEKQSSGLEATEPWSEQEAGHLVQAAARRPAREKAGQTTRSRGPSLEVQQRRSAGSKAMAIEQPREAEGNDKAGRA